MRRNERLLVLPEVLENALDDIGLLDARDHYFGKPRSRGTSHRVYRTPWQGDPRVNIQNAKGKAKPYQVRKVLWAIERLEKEDGKGSRSIYVPGNLV